MPLCGRAKQLACEACGFDFEATYGPRGAGYIECHHVVPLHEIAARANQAQRSCSDLRQLSPDDPSWCAVAHP